MHIVYQQNKKSNNKNKKIMKKKFLSLQNKLMFAMLFLVLSFLAVLSYLYYMKTVREHEINKVILSASMMSVKNSVNNQFYLQDDIVKTYAVSDEMYVAVQTKKIDWIQSHLASLQMNFGRDYFAVYDAKGECLYSYPQGQMLFSADSIKRLSGASEYYFVMDDAVPVHITWSIITHNAYHDRLLPAGGYLIIAKRWDAEFISDLSDDTGMQVSVSQSPLQDESLINCDIDLTDIDHHVIASLYFKQDDFIVQLHQRGKMMFIVVVIGMGLILAVIFFLVRWIVTRPISVVYRALKTGNVKLLDEMPNDIFDDEWTTVAHLVEDNLQKTKDLKALVSTKDKFFDLIAHDLRSPFTAIIGFTRMLADNREDLTTEDGKLYLGYILEASRHANKLLDRLLEWARLQTGRWVPNPQPFVINKLVDSVISFHASNALHHNLHLLKNVKETFTVCADEQMIEIAIRNLLSNAIKFTEPGGFVKINLKEYEQSILVSIVDNGKGMPSALVDSLFQIEKSVVVQDVSGKQGTGLGLILSKDLIEKNGGRIWVESEPGKGSTFHFTVPLCTD